MMRYEELERNIGKRVDIVEGELRLRENGKFLIADSPGDWRIVLDRYVHAWRCQAPKESFLGRAFIPLRRCCGTLAAEYIDHKYGTAYAKKWREMTGQDYNRYMMEGPSVALPEFGLVKTDKIEEDCILDYEYMPGMRHVGVVVNGRILQQIQGRLSSLDEIDMAKVKGIYKCPR